MTASFDDLIEQRLEFGVNELGWRDFGRLAARMNAVDPEWRPPSQAPPADRHRALARRRAREADRDAASHLADDPLAASC